MAVIKRMHDHKLKNIT